MKREIFENKKFMTTFGIKHVFDREIESAEIDFLISSFGPLSFFAFCTIN